MSHLQPWQRTVYFLGEAVMVAGLLWLLYNFFFVKAGPAGPLAQEPSSRAMPP